MHDVGVPFCRLGSYGQPGKGPMPPGPGQGPPRPGIQNGPQGMAQPGPQGDPYAQRYLLT